MRSRPARSIPAAKAPAAARIPAATPAITAKHPLDHTVVIDLLESNSEVSYLDVLIAGWAPRGDGGASFRTRGRGVRQAPVLACRPCHRGHRCSSVVGRCCARGGGPPQLPCPRISSAASLPLRDDQELGRIGWAGPPWLGPGPVRRDPPTREVHCGPVANSSKHFAM